MEVDKTHQNPHHHSVPVAHHHQHSPSGAPSVSGPDEKYAVASDAAAAVAIVGGVGLDGSPTPSKLEPHDPNLLSGHHESPSAAMSMSATGDGSQDENAKRLLSTPTAKERNSLTLDQRRALRRWANEQPTRPSHKACIEWFFSKYNQHISQSTVSHSLSPKYQRLDAVNGDGPQLSGSRLRFGNWPDIEKMVLLWYQQIQSTGRNPTNEELGEKAKLIFMSLPRYRDEKPPEFSPGWIHRFKKRYGLLVRRHRHSTGDPANPGQDFSQDISYLAEQVPRFMAISAETSPIAIKDTISRCLTIETSLHTCGLVRDEIINRIADGMQQSDTAMTGHNLAVNIDPNVTGGDPMYVDDDEGGDPTDDQEPDHDHADMVLTNALRMMQQEDQASDVNPATVREDPQRERERVNGTPVNSTPSSGMAPPQVANSIISTPTGTRGNMRFSDLTGAELSLTPIHSDGPVSTHEKPLRCPFCINQRMLRTIKEAVEHMSTHVVV